MQYLFEQKHRVNFILSYNLHSYLETAARVKQVSKSTYLRDLIQKDWETKSSFDVSQYASDELLQIIATAFATMTLVSDALPEETQADHQALAKSILLRLMEWRDE